MEFDSNVQEVSSQAGPGVDFGEREFVCLLIYLYRDNPHLWKVTNASYLDKYKRINTLKRICETLKIYKPDYTVDQLKKKINILRTNFNKERHKIENAKKSIGAMKNCAVQLAEPNLWYYNELLFLVEQGKVSSTKTVTGASSTLTSLKKKRLKMREASLTIPRSEESETDMIAKCWALKLKRLTPDQRIYAEKIINDTLFEAGMGGLTKHGVTFRTTALPLIQYSCESNSILYKTSPVSE